MRRLVENVAMYGCPEPGQMPERRQSALSMWNESAWVDPYQAGNVHSTTASITEGALRGDTASCLSNGALYLCAPGVNAIRYLPSAIRSLSAGTSFGEYDMDQIRQGTVFQHCGRCRIAAQTLWASLYPANGNPAYNGIDDYNCTVAGFRLRLNKEGEFYEYCEQHGQSQRNWATTASDGEGVLEKSFLRSRRYHDRPGKNLSGCGRPASFLR